ncbi:hypothetical protein ABFU39_10345 [Xanthomonas campestris pv. raphani]|uniref:hypothetical protein n=2 Tax=Xanthomonas campestris TaxID=339 RepID=UPI001E565774|nr:hypothetical protein [Xanthomonas campestris]MEA9975256.1 hypothetical protein [Xanthomonas campestris pv. raphani]
MARLISFQPRGRRVACSPPTSLGALAPIIVQPGASLADDVDWAIAQLMVLPLEEIRFAIDRVELEFSRGDLSGAMDALVGLRARFGFSCWGLEAQIALTQMRDGLEAQKRMRSRWSDAGLKHAAFIAVHLASERNEEIMSHANFITRTEKFLSSLEGNEVWRDFLHFRAFKSLRSKGDEKCMHNVLRGSAAVSPLDLYDALVTVVPVLPRSISTESRLCMEFAVKHVDSERRSKLLGDVADAARRNDSLGGGWRSLVGEDLKRLFDRSSVGESAERNLLKTSLNFDFFPSGRQIRRLVQELRQSDFEKIERLSITSLSMSGDVQDHWAVALRTCADKTTSYGELFTCVAIGTSSRAEVSNKLAHGDNQDLSVLAKMNCEALVGEGEWLKALGVAVNSCLQLPGMAQELPIERYLGSRSWRDLASSAASPDLLLALHFASRNAIRQLDREKFSRFLQYCAYEMIRLRRLTAYADIARDNSIPESVRIFVCEHVLIARVMEYHPGIQSSRQLAEARIAVCQQLSELDSKASGKYAEEIKELTYKIEVQEATDSFDQSRLHVDANLIRERCVSLVTEDFERYRSLDAIVLGDVQAIRQAIIALRQAPQSSAESARVLLEQPKTDADVLLLDIIEKIRAEYLFNPDLGLDAVLSLRMRHGSFAGHLRGELELARLITSFDASSGSYKENEYWRQVIEPSGVHDEILQKALADFSKEFDALVRYFVEEILQVKTEKKGDGAISVNLWSVQFNLLKSEIDRDLEVGEFVRRVVAIFEAELKENLAVLKKRLDRDIREPAEALLVKLRRDLGPLAPYVGSNDLFDAIAHAGTHIANNIEKIKRWFVYTTRREQPKHYKMEQILAIALQVTRYTYPTFRTHVDHNFADLDVVIGDGAFTLADALFIVLENAHKYASPAAPSIYISAQVLDDSRGIRFTTTNDVDSSPTNAELQRIEDARGLITQGVGLSKVRQEGGTGLLKLSRISRGQGNGEPIEFGFEDRRFHLSFCVPMRGGNVHVGE